MTLAIVQAVIAGFVAIVATLSGLLSSTALLLPGPTSRAEQTLRERPRQCFFAGLALAIPLAVSVAIIRIPSPLAKLVGFLGVMALAALAVLGCAGLARLMAARVGEMSGARSSFGALVRSSLVYSIGVLFPIAGWYLLLPISVICGAGAGLLSLAPEQRKSIAPPVYAGAPGAA